MASSKIDNLLSNLDNIIKRTKDLSYTDIEVINLGIEKHYRSMEFIAKKMQDIRNNIQSVYTQEQKRIAEEAARQFNMPSFNGVPQPNSPTIKNTTSNSNKEKKKKKSTLSCRTEAKKG